MEQNGMEAMEQQLEQRQEGMPEASTKEIYIANISFDATDVHLREAFSKYGPIEKLFLPRDGRGLTRG